MTIEALILEQGTRATLRVGAWAVEVDAAEFRAWAAYSGFDLAPAGGGETKIILRGAADCERVFLAWTDLSASR
jgi:hypothetical protein